ncbi:N-acetylmuramidase domain-containing protein [uncultured Methylobacterium sp.]|jgi:hypothetical protein|uniref:N-acetylmuramidase domain-containing protein n=1 Tax=uncultured Methylobacterium sp. TaxID=157278 RepID=UPI002604B936|nr:N-acetylmuramidase domain-containing protein [uncultured Methylobacterium sp.]
MHALALAAVLACGGLAPCGVPSLDRSSPFIAELFAMSPSLAPDAFARLHAAGYAATVVRLADLDLPRIGHAIGVGEDPIHAFLDVETAGGGYDAKGRLKALYEPHRAFKNAAKVSRALRDRFVAAGLAYESWGAKPYPADSYPRIAAAVALDETVALLSASWGIGQVLGENFRAAGYGSVQEMVAAYATGGEAEQLASAVRFIKARGLDDELRAIDAKIRRGVKPTAADWTAFAEGYNGPSQAKHGYAGKLATRSVFWMGKPDTAWTLPPVATGSLPGLALTPPAAPAAPTSAKCTSCGKALAA